jgi:2-methylcitrate dehydratase PrpD
MAIKPYPCCHYLHAFLECVLGLREAHGLAPDAVEDVECRVPPGEVAVICEPLEAKRRPRSPYDARFSLPWAVAAALVDGRVGLDTFDSGRLGDPRVLALAERVTYRVDPELPFPRGFPGGVRIRLRSGQVLEAEAPDGPGGPQRPLPREAVVAKFRDNAGRVLEPARVAALERAALELEGLRHVDALLAPCRG